MKTTICTLFLTSLLAVGLTFLAACGSDKQQGRRKPQSRLKPVASSPYQSNRSSNPALTAKIIGKVSFEGDKPFQKTINFGGELQCADLHSNKVKYDDLVINQNGTIKSALVHIKSEVVGDFTSPTEHAVMDQVGCVFTPHVLAVRTGQPVDFLNSDPLLHNVRGMPKEGKPFNKAQPRKGMKYSNVFDQQEIGIVIRCDVHAWMKGIVHTLSHPFFALTNEGGTFQIEGVPAGTHTLEAWHEKLGSQQLEFTVKGGETKTLDFVFSGQ